MTTLQDLATMQYITDLGMGTIKQALIDTISAIPDNPKIDRINDQCFTISVKDLSPDLCLTPAYYDFKRQYRLIVEIIEDNGVSRAQSWMDEIITKGSIRYHTERTRFHPDVVEHLKAIMG